jgi:hypothetical protein
MRIYGLLTILQYGVPIGKVANGVMLVVTNFPRMPTVPALLPLPIAPTPPFMLIMTHLLLLLLLVT